jgi:hypothetical protein
MRLQTYTHIQMHTHTHTDVRAVIAIRPVTILAPIHLYSRTDAFVKETGCISNQSALIIISVSTHQSFSLQSAFIDHSVSIYYILNTLIDLN